MNEQEAVYRRLILTSHDLMEAGESLRRILELDEFDKDATEQIDSAAHLTRLVVAYSRPWSGNFTRDGTAKAPPNDLLNQLADGILATHERILELRRREFAHSDAEAARVHIAIVGKPTPSVTAIHRRPRMPLTREEAHEIGVCIDAVSAAIAGRQVQVERAILQSRSSSP